MISALFYLPVHLVPEASLHYHLVASPFVYSYLLCPVNTFLEYLFNFTLILAGKKFFYWRW